MCYIPLIRSQSPFLLFLAVCARLPFPLFLSLVLPLSLYLSGVAMTCLGFDVFVCIVTETMLPPTSESRRIFCSNLSRRRSESEKRAD